MSAPPLRGWDLCANQSVSQVHLTSRRWRGGHDPAFRRRGMRPEVEAAVQVAPRLDGLDRRVLVYFKLAGAALLHQSEDAACA